MKTLEISTLETIQVGDNIESFCAGFGAVAIAFEIGVVANLWNPIGWGAGLAVLTIAGGCAIYAVR